MAEKVSVLFAIPVGNAQTQLLDATRSSIASQTFPNALIEVIEVQYAPLVAGGLAAAFNAAREAATGTYVVHAEPGVVWDIHKIERQVTYVQDHPDCAGCVHAMTRRDAHGRSVPMRLHALHTFGFRIGSLLGPPWGPGAALFVKDIMDQVGAYRRVDEVLWEFGVRLTDRSHRLGFMDDDLALWRSGLPRKRSVMIPSGLRHRFLKSYLDRTDVAALFEHTVLVSEQNGQLVRGALYFNNDDLDAAHTLFQQAGQPEASATANYWHGMVHRREPDFNNARSWFLKAEDLPAKAVLFQAICPLLQQAIQMPDYGAARDLALSFLRHLQNLGTWDAGYFLDLCQRCVQENDASLRRLLEDIQEKEFETLFEWTFRQATGQVV